ncbi:MAG TPA: septum formation family protein [Gammaproteobacteria bacterium]|nr:septum formation family protein [Gammaproteobacteria bacterium]
MRNWIIGIAIAAGVYGVNIAMRADRDETGAIVDEGSIDPFEMRVGDCFDDGSTFEGDNPEVSSVPGVPCSSPHDNEVYAVFDVEVATFPEGDEMARMAFESCKQRFTSFVGKDYESSELDIATLYPTRESWNRQNDREVVCAVYDLAANKLTGSVKGRAL